MAGSDDWFSSFDGPMLYPSLVLLPALSVLVLPMPPAYVVVKCVRFRDGCCWKANRNTCCWEEDSAALAEGTCTTTITRSSTSSGVTVTDAAVSRGDHGCSSALMTALLRSYVKCSPASPLSGPCQTRQASQSAMVEQQADRAYKSNGITSGGRASSWDRNRAGRGRRGGTSASSAGSGGGVLSKIHVFLHMMAMLVVGATTCAGGEYRYFSKSRARIAYSYISCFFLCLV